MEHEFRSNGRVAMQIISEDPLERAFIEAFISAAEKGQAVKLKRSTYAPDSEASSFEISVEK